MRRLFALLIVFFLGACAMRPPLPSAFSLDGTVQEVFDGDSLSLIATNGVRFSLRLSDIDAPETAHPAAALSQCNPVQKLPRPEQPGGEAAKAFLGQHAAAGSPISAQCYEIDAYGRAVCHLFAAQKNLNLTLATEGLAMLAERAEWVRDPASTAAEAAAKRDKRGVWAQGAAVHPSQWRKQCWCEGDCPGAAH